MFEDMLRRIAALERAAGSGGGGGGGSGGFTYAQDSAPVPPIVIGSTWYDTSTGDAFVWWDSYWVQFAPSVGGGDADFVMADGSTSMTGAIDTESVPAGANSVRAKLGEGYDLYADDDGPGSDDTRLWISGPDGGAVYVGPRGGGSSLHEIHLRADDTKATGKVWEVDPSGASAKIVEYGSNANGEWAKYSNGVMQVWRVWATSVAITSAYGSLFQGTSTFLFPVSFVSPPAVAFGNSVWSTGRSWTTVYATTTTQFNVAFIDVASRASTSTSVSYQAIGRWR